MQHYRLLPSLLPLLVLAACTEQEPLTAPAEPGGPAFSHTAGHKVVNSPADPGDGTCDATQCTLREAIKAPGTTAVTFAPGLTGPITLAAPDDGGGPLGITSALTISGPAGGMTIRRRSTDPPFRILRVGEGATVTLTNLTLRNGNTDLQGGGIINLGTLALINCTVAGNASSARGGGIANKGPLTLTHSTVSGNSGDGIFNHEVRLVATNSVIARNSGSGIDNLGGTLELSNTSVSDNAGRGIAEDRSNSSTMDRVRVTGNSSGGISFSHGRLTITNSTIAENSARDGAGILNSFGGSVTVAKSTVANNAASEAGGGIFDEDDPFGRVGAGVTLVNSTVTGNSAGSGGGIQIKSRGSAFVGLINSTVASNSARDGGGGIRQTGFSNDDVNSVGLTNSLVARNTAPEGPDLLGTVGGIGARFSLIGDGTGSGLTNTDGNLVGNVSPNTGPIDPVLGPLADNGGPTRTRALLPGSPAIDAASSSDCPGKDQRGVLRPQGPACDIGSYERE